MRLVPWSAIALLPLVACLQITTDPGSGAGSGSTSGASDDGGGSGGVDCTTDPATQVVLCAGLDGCPGVDVDPGAFPGCGFRMNAGGAPIDLECLCSGSVCPIGAPTTCAQASQLLQSQTVLGVCQQVSEGLCVQVAAPDAGSVAPGCDRTCQSECGSAADCLQICGC
ncbi:MAG: hypothetical protein ACLP1X_01375 [Polyangiaceae bacterium]|jgi:hypothetical protein